MPKIKPGDHVRITDGRCNIRQGKVVSVDGSPGSWNIELLDPIHGFAYWKQAIDGGEIEEWEAAPDNIQPSYQELVDALDLTATIAVAWMARYTEDVGPVECPAESNALRKARDLVNKARKHMKGDQQ